MFKEYSDVVLRAKSARTRPVSHSTHSTMETETECEDFDDFDFEILSTLDETPAAIDRSSPVMTTCVRGEDYTPDPVLWVVKIPRTSPLALEASLENCTLVVTCRDRGMACLTRCIGQRYNVPGDPASFYETVRTIRETSWRSFLTSDQRGLVLPGLLTATNFPLDSVYYHNFRTLYIHFGTLL